MEITCPKCKGQRRYYISKPIPMAPITNTAAASNFAEASYERELIDCVRCNGVGRTEATDRIPMMQDGRQIGTVLPSFDPASIKSKSFWYTPRTGDFERDGDTWVARPELGPGDLDAVPGFART